MDLLSEQEQEEFRDLDSRIDARSLYEWASSNGKLTEVDIRYTYLYKIKKGEYLALSQDLFPKNEFEVRRWVELMEKDKTTGYCSCDFLGINKPCAFVVEKNVPKEFQEYVAIHEIYEGEHLPRCHESYRTHMFHASRDGVDLKLEDPEIEAHKFACEVELGNVFIKGKEFSMKYMSWLPDEYFENADPNFFKERNRKEMSPLELTLDFIELIVGYDKEEFMKYFPWLSEK